MSGINPVVDPATADSNRHEPPGALARPPPPSRTSLDGGSSADRPSGQVRTARSVMRFTMLNLPGSCAASRSLRPRRHGSHGSQRQQHAALAASPRSNWRHAWSRRADPPHPEQQLVLVLATTAAAVVLERADGLRRFDFLIAVLTGHRDSAARVQSAFDHAELGRRNAVSCSLLILLRSEATEVDVRAGQVSAHYSESV